MALSKAFISSLCYYCTIAILITQMQAVTLAVTPAVTPGATTPPPLEISCSSGQIENIFGNGIKEKAVVIDFGNGTMCHISEGTCNWKNEFKKIHVIYDETETNANVVAGHPYYYELECKPAGGYVARASAVPFSIGSTMQPYIHKDFTPSDRPGITIEIYKGTEKISKAVYIGESLSLKIKGPGNSKVFPIECNATSTNNVYLLWDNTKCTSYDKAIMEDNWKFGNDSISIEMNAFRFVDSSSVTIECSAYICQSSDSACISAAMKTCPEPASRRRRSSNIESHPLHTYKEETSSVSFTVADRFDGTNGSEGVSGDILLYLTAVLITMFCLGRQ